MTTSSNINATIDDYRSYIYGEKNLSLETVNQYCSQASLFLTYLAQKDIDAASFKEPIVHEYLSYLMDKKNYKPRSMALALSIIKSFVKFQQIEHIFEAVFRFRSFFYEIAHEVGSILHQPLFLGVISLKLSR